MLLDTVFDAPSPGWIRRISPDVCHARFGNRSLFGPYAEYETSKTKPTTRQDNRNINIDARETPHPLRPIIFISSL